MNAKHYAKRVYPKRLFLILIAALVFPMTKPLTAFAAEDGNTLSMDVTFKAAKNLLPGTEYGKGNLSDIVDVSVSINGDADAVASTEYYVLPTKTFEELSDKSEMIVKENNGFVTDSEYEGDHYMLPVTFVTYHTFTDKMDVKGDEAEMIPGVIPADDKKAEVERARQEKIIQNASETGDISETKMATENVIFCISHTAGDIVEMYKSGKWYESSEKGVTWKYTLNDDGLIDRLYTDNLDLGENIVSGALIIPTTVNDIPVVGIGSGTEKPFVPVEANGYDRIVFPETLKVIGDYSFYKNRTNTQAFLTENIIEIGEKAFYASQINDVVINGKCAVGELAFANCRFLKSISINGDVTVERRAFDGGTGGSVLESLTLTGRPVLKEYAFCNNDLLREIALTDETSLDQTAFEGCSFERIRVSGNPVTPEGSFGGAEIIS